MSRPSRTRRRERHALPGVIGAAVVALSVLVFFSLMVGDIAFGADEVITVFGDPHGESVAHTVLWTIRVPRTLIAVLAGSALSVAGALVQSVTRNPIAEPGVLGVSAGAGLAVVLAGSLLGVTGATGIMWAAFTGALVTTLVVYVVASGGRRSADPTRLLLAGVAISAFFAGITTVLMMLSPDTFSHMSGWAAGSLARRGWDPLLAALPFLATAGAIALVLAPNLNQLQLGDELGSATGGRPLRTRTGMIIVVALLAGAATGMAGPIAFVGLMVPHIARRFVGVSEPAVLVCSAALGPVVLLAADIAARIIIPRGELPVGIVMGLVGAPMLVATLRRLRRVSV